MRRHLRGVLVIGVGNDYRRDDAIGLLIARKLRPQVPSSIEVIESSGDGSALMEAWKERRAVIIIDAVAADARPGTLYRFDLATDEIPSALISSTHAFGVAEAVELAISLEELPPRLLFLGIQGKHFTYGLGLSAEVAAAADGAVGHVLEMLESLREPAGEGWIAPRDLAPSGILRSHS